MIKAPILGGDWESSRCPGSGYLKSKYHAEDMGKTRANGNSKLKKRYEGTNGTKTPRITEPVVRRFQGQLEGLSTEVFRRCKPDWCLHLHHKFKQPFLLDVRWEFMAVLAWWGM